MWNGKVEPKILPIDISEDEFAKLLEVTPQMKHRVAFLLAWGAGMRVSEVINLKPEYVDFDQKKIMVKQGKGKKDRIVPLPKGLKQTHMKYIPFDFEIRALQKTFQRYAEKSGLKKRKARIRFHSLRHGFATQCIKKGISLEALRQMMGHTHIGQTQVYLWLSPKDILNEYMEKF